MKLYKICIYFQFLLTFCDFRARNSIGRQKVGCRISIVPAGPPDPPINCTAETAASPLPTAMENDKELDSDETNSADSREATTVPTYYPALKNKRSADCKGKDCENTEGLSRIPRQIEIDGPILTVNCLEGFNGGLPQFFILEAKQRGRLKSNLTRYVIIIKIAYT